MCDHVLHTTTRKGKMQTAEPEQRLTIGRGDKVRLPDNHPNSPGKEAIVVMCGMYQVRVRLIDESRETWAFSNDVTILRKAY